MMKYIIALGALVVVVVGYLLLNPASAPEAPAPASGVTAPAPVAEPAPAAPAPVAPAPVAPAPVAPEATAPVTPDEEVLLEQMAAEVREGLPEALTDTLTLTDALFLPRMRIMEFAYVTTDADTRTVASDMQRLIDDRARTICLEGRGMFGMDVTLRNSFTDRNGDLFHRVYLLPEDCAQFYQ